MTRNMGTADRALRTLLTIVFVVAALAVGAGSVAGVVLLVFAGVFLATSAVGFCPLYALFGFSTRARRSLHA